MINLRCQRVLVTGGRSMVMSAVCKALEQRGAIVDPCPHALCNVCDYNDTYNYVKEFAPDYIVHGAAFNGNVQFNLSFPLSIYSRTTEMALSIMHAGVDRYVKGILSVLPSCAYPDLGPDAILSEHQLWQGESHESVACHGMAKRNLHQLSKLVHRKYGIRATCVILNNCYGPGDHTDLEKTKVVMSLIKKFVDAQRAGQEEVECWGTGKARRELLFSRDAGEGIARALESYEDVSLPLNIGCGDDISIYDLAHKIAELSGSKARIVWNTEKPEGQLKKLLDVQRMKEHLNWSPPTSLDEGLRQTIEWYKGLSNVEIAA